MSREYVLQPFRPPVNLQIDYAAELNPQQFAAVTAIPGPALVIAGAGSGKTRTLTYRVAYLLEQGIPADRILLLTFTNKAAREMMHRVTDLLGSELADLWGGTFHSIGARILRRNAAKLGFRPDFTILDREDAVDLVKACVGELDIDLKATRFPKAEVLANIFSMAVNQRLPTPVTMEKDYPHFEELTARIDEVGRRFVERKRAANAMDFDDLLALWLRLLEEHDDVRDQYQRRFQFILVDEYQDTNKLQSDLIDLLGARHKNVLVVGDDSQSIYSWRGANFRNIFEFPSRYPGTSTYKIETNYRSTPEILSVANAVIAANTQQFAKELVPARPAGVKPVLIACGDGNEQAAFVAQRILELREEGADMNEMVVLYRSHFHALELQLELTRRNIPFSITSGIRFFEQAHIKDVTSHLRLVCNPSDELAFKRVVQLLPGIGGKGADKLWQIFAHKTPAGETQASSASDKHRVATALQACVNSVPKKTAAAWAQFTATISQLEDSSVRQKSADMIRLVVEAGYEDYVRATFTNADNRLEDLDQLANFAVQFPSPEEFLAQMALLTNIEAEEQPAATKDDEQVRLSTIHQAKGLEFDIVFIIMLCDGLFPSARSMESTEGEEEERRLFYVAVTRAKNELYLSYPLIRTMQAYSGDMMQQPSRFLAEIPKDRLDEWNLRPSNPYG